MRGEVEAAARNQGVDHGGQVLAELVQAVVADALAGLGAAGATDIVLVSANIIPASVETADVATLGKVPALRSALGTDGAKAPAATVALLRGYYDKRIDKSDQSVLAKIKSTTAEIDAIEMNAVPAWRSAVRVRFPVRSGRAALLRIVLDDGQPAPAGAEIDLQGDAQVFYVARRGEAYLTGLQPSNRLRLRHGESACDIDVVLPEGKADEIVRLGPLKCEGVKR